VERFTGIMIEHFAGAFPLWLAPTQVTILPVADRHNDFAFALCKELKALGIRAEVDDATESVGKKIRNAEKMKVPRMLVVGDKEAEGGPLTVRVRGEAEQKAQTKEEFVNEVLKMVKERAS